MSREVWNGPTCVTNVGTYKVESTNHREFYEVVLDGPEGTAICSCPGFLYRNTCKHISMVQRTACLYNPQWFKGNPQVNPYNEALVANMLWPSTEVSLVSFDAIAEEGTKCPNCGGPTYLVAYLG